jgi:hypothetical protein
MIIKKLSFKITGISKVVFKNIFLFYSLTKQYVKLKIVRGEQANMK